MSRISTAILSKPNIASKFLELATRLNNSKPSSISALEGGKVQPENVIVEFGSPNIAKPLHMGHLRSTVTGHYVTKICKAAGHKVTTMCYLGDWGTQFGVLHAGLVKWVPRNEDEPLIKTVHKLDLSQLLEYYVRAVKEEETDKEFANQTRKFSLALEKQEREALDIWATIREKTVNHLGNVWNQFGIQYDVIQGESEFAISSDHTEQTMNILKEKANLLKANDGCIFALIPIKTKAGEINQVKVPLLKADGSTLYLLRDIVAARNRLDRFRFDRMIYVVDKSQSNHFINLFNILSQIEFKKLSSENNNNNNVDSKFLQHVSFGRVEGMSTRSGNFVLLSDVINEGTLLMEEARIQSTNTRRENEYSTDQLISTKLALSALIINSLKIRRNRDVKFDWTEALKPNGDTGVKLQYTHARLISLEVKQLKQNFPNQIENYPFTEIDMEYILNDSLAFDLAVHLVSLEQAFWESYDELEPCVLVSYLFKLCNRISKCLKELKIQSETNREIAQTRLKLFVLSRKILAFGLNTLGIEPLNRI